jgi:hypothetical protein
VSDPVVDWLLDSDPAIRWQVMRDLLDRPEDEWRAERARVETHGWGAQLLALQDADGQWAGGAFLPDGFTRELWEGEGQPWTATSHVLTQLRELGLDPASPAAVSTVRLLSGGPQWWPGAPFWGGETEECINGRLVADGAYLGVDMSALVDRLVGERLADGGWNCERAEGSVRSSFDSTINVLDGLREHELATGGTAASRAARATGEEFLLERRLFRRLSTGRPADPEFLTFVHPARWHYDVLRALDHFRRASELAGPGGGARRDDRLAERSRWCAAVARATAGGCSTGCRAAGCGSTSTTASDGPPAGSRSTRSASCGGGTPARRERPCVSPIVRRPAAGQLPTQVGTGAGALPLVVPWSPKDVEAAGAREPLYDRFSAVCAAPDRVKPAFHPFASWLPAGHVHVTRQPRSGAVPVDVTVTVAVKPPGQLLSVRQVAVHALAVLDESGCVVTLTAAEGAETFPAPSRARTV